MAVVTQQEFDDWLELPVTKQLKKQIRKDIENMKEMLIDAGFDDLKELQGRVKASVNLLNVEYNDLYE